MKEKEEERVVAEEEEEKEEEGAWLEREWVMFVRPYRCSRTSRCVRD